METPQDSTRRSSLETTDEDLSRLNESIISELSHASFNPMDISQISGWSAVNAKWDISLPLDLSFTNDVDGKNGTTSEDETSGAEAVEKANLHEIFVEYCCTLYNDIQNAIDELEFEDQIPCIEKLEERQKSLASKAHLLSESAPDYCDIVILRMQTIDRAMEQLRLRHDVESARSSSRDNPHSPSYQFRKWIQGIEGKLYEFRGDITKSKTASDLQKLCADQQLLQLQIETEGQSLLTTAKKHLQSKQAIEGKKTDRAQRNLQQLEQRLLGAWLKSLENLERVSSLLKHLQDSETPTESCSEDEEPLIKRRRTTSSSQELPDLASPSSIPYSRTSTADVLLIPSSTESECATEDDQDIIRFTPGDYEPLDEMPEMLCFEPTTSPASSGPENCSSSSSRQLHDVGYSSGENSIHEALNLIGETEMERRPRVKPSPTKDFYKTVPLDEAGVTDTEVPMSETSPRDQLPEELLSDSMIVQADVQVSSIPDDYSEVMELMDDDFEARIDQLRRAGTQWRELKPKRVSTPKRSGKAPSEATKASDFSCEASSEESDSGKDRSRQSLYDPAALPPIPGNAQRKRRFKKAIRSSTQGFLKNSLTNVAMDESVYIFPESKDDPMSQSLNASFFASKTPASKRKHDRHRRMHRSASDYVNLAWNLESLPNSFHSSFAAFEPLMSSTLKRSSPRRPSVESFASTTSSGTVQETGDAHYEWDDYRDPPSLSEVMPQIIQLDDASTSSILDNTIIDEDFQSQIPFDDQAGIESTIQECQQNYYKIRRIMNDYSSDENKDIKKALRMSAKENVKKLTAIVKALPRNLNMDQVNDVDVLQKEWKATLDELGPSEEDDLDPVEQMEVDEHTVTEIRTQLAEMKVALQKLLILNTEKMTIADLEGFIEERRQIWDNLVARKTSLQAVADQPGNRFNNGELIALLKIVEQSLQTIGDSTLHLEAAMNKYHSMGSIQESLQKLNDKMSNNEIVSSEVAEEIKLELSRCQERMDALETVCNGLTTQLGDLAALSGERKPGKQAKYWKELKEYKDTLKGLKEKFSKLPVKQATSKKPESPKLRKRKTKETSTNTATTTTLEIPASQHSLARRVFQSFHDSRFLQFLLGTTALLLIGLILVSYCVDDSPQNNWRRMFGPQLDYINGAPPS